MIMFPKVAVKSAMAKLKNTEIPSDINLSIPDMASLFQPNTGTQDWLDYPMNSFEIWPLTGQLHLPHLYQSSMINKPCIENCDDSDSVVNSSSHSQSQATSVSTPDHNDDLACVEGCVAESKASADVPIVPSSLAPTLSGRKKAYVALPLEGRRDDNRTHTPSLNDSVSEAVADENLRLERSSREVSTACDETHRSQRQEPTIFNLSRMEEHVVRAEDHHVLAESPASTQLPSPLEDPLPDLSAEGSTDSTLKRPPDRDDRPTPSPDRVTSQVGSKPTRTKRGLNEVDPNDRGNETRRPKRPRGTMLPSRSSRTLRSLPSRTRTTGSGDNAADTRCGPISCSARGQKQSPKDRSENSARKSHRGQPTFAQNPDLGGPTAPKARTRSSLVERPRSNTTDKILPHSSTSARSNPSHRASMPSTPPSLALAGLEHSTVNCDTCGFAAGHILQLSDTVEALLHDGSSISIMQLFLGFIRDYATQRLAQTRPATNSSRFHHDAVRHLTSNTNDVPMSDTGGHDGSRRGETDADGSSGDSQLENQTDSADDSEEDSESDNETVSADSVCSVSEDRTSDGIKATRRRWKPLEEVRLRAWVMEKKSWSWIAKKLGRSEGGVSQHWGIMSKTDGKGTEE
ncbi:hypothetical protein F5Y09DRAFT_226325 [Xylaria sp. FL1042]|nr:hypothetical protein F5Y09DRAFT_226325 [Xylaria sp. FL1042]